MPDHLYADLLDRHLCDREYPECYPAQMAQIKQSFGLTLPKEEPPEEGADKYHDETYSLGGILT